MIDRKSIISTFLEGITQRTPRCERQEDLFRCMSAKDSIDSTTAEGKCLTLYLNFVCVESAMKLYCSEAATKNIRLTFYISKQLDDKHSSNCEKLKEAILHHVGGAQITVLNEMEAELGVVQFPAGSVVTVTEQQVTQQVTLEPDRGSRNSFSIGFVILYMVYLLLE
ncbi:hypothetical protein Ddc_15873 [Ditylenchus destructor]|nr:hypothetical protein Ddc_15873 [Ditylenchus destructor]